MQDKDLDKLFQSALNDYEIEPSAKVWPGVTSQLDARKAKRFVIPWLGIAAGLVLMVTAGLLFIPGEIKITRHHSKVMAKLTDTHQIIVKPNKNARHVVIAPVNSIAIISINKKSNQQLTRILIKPVIIKNNIRQSMQLASARPEKEIVQPVLPDTVIRILAKPVIDETPVFAVIKPVDASATKMAVLPAKKRRIRSLGDVFNVMIAAVDKRQDKIIEFSNTDEDDATITGVNIGVIKIKKEK